MNDTPDSRAVEEIQNLLSAWAHAVEASDVDTIVSLVTPDAEFWANGAAPMEGREALRTQMTSFFKRFQLSQKFDCAELVVRDDIAFMRGTEHNTLHPIGGGGSSTHDQRAFSVMRRGADNSWRFWRGMTNLPTASDR